MTSAVESIALLTPLIASNAVFATRRLSRGVDNMNDKPLYALMNADIAAGQTIKGARAVKAVSEANNLSACEKIQKLEKGLENLEESSKIFKGIGTVTRFVADNINPIICVASGVKVLSSEDKGEALVTEGLALAGMFKAESLAKQFMGMPIIKKGTDGVRRTIPREALYHNNPFIEKQVNVLKDYCATKKLFNSISLKALPGVLKGTLFVLASIGGYKLGTYVANVILGKNKKSAQTVKHYDFNQQTTNPANKNYQFVQTSVNAA